MITMTWTGCRVSLPGLVDDGNDCNDDTGQNQNAALGLVS